MRHERGIAILLAVTLASTAGCGTVGGMFRGRTEPAVKAPPGREQDFVTALEYLRRGNERQARAALERVVEAPPLGGVTDEALFRLALLHLDDNGGKETGRTRSLLERLRNEYPNSLWTRQSAPLAAYLAGVGYQRDREEREIRNLKQLNLSLSRDNKELRQSIERLKSLDIELEQKIRR
ncbi:MAG TPA: tetratricopeptide repeat protein [Desulfuromonadaceae bacterium]